MKKVLLIVLGIFIIFTGEALAFDDLDISISTSLYTKHFTEKEEGHYNETNELIGIDVNGWFGSTFVNSDYNRSWFVGKRFSTKKYDIIDDFMFARLNLYLGPLYGYGDKHVPTIEGWTLGILPSAEIGIDHFGMELVGIPTDTGVICVLGKIYF